jgi:hypothetical protein
MSVCHTALHIQHHQNIQFSCLCRQELCDLFMNISFQDDKGASIRVNGDPVFTNLPIHLGVYSLALCQQDQKLRLAPLSSLFMFTIDIDLLFNESVRYCCSDEVHISSTDSVFHTNTHTKNWPDSVSEIVSLFAPLKNVETSVFLTPLIYAL